MATKKPEADPQANYAAAQAEADKHWSAHSGLRGPMRNELRAAVAGIEGVTGLPAGPGADRLVDLFLDYAEQHSDNFLLAASFRSDAMLAQQRRDEAQAALPVTLPVTVGVLDSAHLSDVRKWLRDAGDKAVRAALQDVTNAVDQAEWADQLMKWARADGTTAQVLAAINEHVVKANPHADMSINTGTAGVGASSTYASNVPEVTTAAANANLDNEPASDASAENIMAWVGDNIDRARVRYDIETEGAQRPDVLAALVDVLDTDSPDVPSDEE